MSESVLHPMHGSGAKRLILHSVDRVTGERVDRALALLDPSLSRTMIQRLIVAGAVFRQSGAGVEAGPAVLVPVQDATDKVRMGEIFELHIPPAVPLAVEAEAIVLSVLFEDADLLVVNKPAGMTVHPGAGTQGGTLVNALLHHCRGTLSGIGGVMRPGIVHRLDKDTSGLLVVAKHDRVHQHLSEQFKAHTTTRQYLAIVKGRPSPAQGKVDAPIGRHPKDRQKMAVVTDGRRAVTHYKILAALSGFSLIACRLETGRTHQIRVHLSHQGHPLLGDPVYGRPYAPPASWPDAARACVTAFNRQALHAAILGFTHPVTGERLRFETDPPADFQQLLETLRSVRI